MASQITRVGCLDPDSIPLSRWDQENRGLKPNEIGSQPVSHLLVVEIVKVLSTTRQCTRFEVTDYTEVPSISYRRSKTFVCTRWLNDFNRDSTSSLRPGAIIMAEMQFEYFQDKFSGIINRDTDITILKEDSPLALAMKFPRVQREDREYTSAPKRKHDNIPHHATDPAPASKKQASPSGFSMVNPPVAADHLPRSTNKNNWSRPDSLQHRATDPAIIKEMLNFKEELERTNNVKIELQRRLDNLEEERRVLLAERKEVESKQAKQLALLMACLEKLKSE